MSIEMATLAEGWGWLRYLLVIPLIGLAIFWKKYRDKQV